MDRTTAIQTMNPEPAAADAARRGEILGVQYLRFLAAFSVVYFHTGVLNPDFAWPRWIPREFGAFGVDLFFVISGFVMMLVTAGKDAEPVSFLMRRIERIAPFYWGATLFAAAVGAIYPSAMIANKVDLTHVSLSLVFLPHVNPARGTITPFYGIGWTLNFEMYFYFVFALMLALLKSPGQRVLGLIVWCAVGSSLFGAFDPQIPIIRVYTNPMMVEFVAGAAIGWAYGRGFIQRIPAGAAFALVGIAAPVIVSSVVSDESRILVQGSAAVATLCGALALEARGFMPRWRWALLLGDATYAIYLVHPMTLSASRVFTKALHIPVERAIVGIPSVVLLTALSVGAGVLIHLWIERPMLAWFHRERQARQAKHSAAILRSSVGGA